MQQKTLTSKVSLYLLGCICFSVGATLFILSNLGTDPLDVFAVGVKKTFGLMIGTTQSLFAIGCLGIWSALNKWKFPPITTFLTFFLCGYMIDFGLWLTNSQSVLNPIIEVLLGVILCTQGSALILMSSFGIRAMDLVAISLMEKTNKPFWVYKGFFELLLLVSGWILGGVVGIGTVLFLLFVGWFIQPCIKLNAKLGVPNYGKIS